jgi:hypothetical protein
MPGTRTSFHRPLALALLLTTAGLPALARQEATPEPSTASPAEPPRTFQVSRATSEIRIDGTLDEPAWGDALTFDLPYEWSPGDNIEPPVKTDVLVTYDDRNLYLAWRAHDPNPSAIRAHIMDRDSVDTFVQDDHVLVSIDTFDDERRGFQFRVNPLGVQMDAVMDEGQGIEDFSFDMIWSSAGSITDTGYVVEVAIPLDQLRFPRTGGVQTWGFDVGRSYPRSVRHRMSAARIERGATCVLCNAIKVTGFENLEPGRNLEITPTLTATRNDRISSFPDGDLEAGDEDLDPGVTVRWGVTPGVSLSGTLNPDFSQVEADVAQLEVNERFALFFPEKRPFFLEGIDLFATPIQAVFTRTVVDPDWGAKVTGKQGPHGFGVFVTEDDVNTVLVPSNENSAVTGLPGGVTGSVLRYQRDIGRTSTIGALYTGREGEGGYHNRVYGLDSFLRFDEANSLRLQALQSDTRYPGAMDPDLRGSLESATGEAYLVDFEHSSRSWSWSVEYHDRSPSFRADSGFVSRVDFRQVEGYAQRTFWGEEDDWYTRSAIGIYSNRTEDHDGTTTDETIDLYGNFSGPYQSFAEISLQRDERFFRGRRYDELLSSQVYAEAQPNGKVRTELFVNVGETVDFQNNRPADQLELSPSVELKLGRHVNLRLDHTLRRLDVEGGELFEANLSELRMIYNFNVRSFFRAIVQYLDLTRDPALFDRSVEPEVEDLFTQLLFSYKVNARTVLFLGYTDSRLGLQETSLTQTGRSFFVKVGYAWTL